MAAARAGPKFSLWISPQWYTWAHKKRRRHPQGFEPWKLVQTHELRVDHHRMGACKIDSLLSGLLQRPQILFGRRVACSVPAVAGRPGLPGDRLQNLLIRQRRIAAHLCAHIGRPHPCRSALGRTVQKNLVAAQPEMARLTGEHLFNLYPLLKRTVTHHIDPQSVLRTGAPDKAAPSCSVTIALLSGGDANEA